MLAEARTILEVSRRRHLPGASSARGSFARARKASSTGLTERELDVLRLLGGESSVRQIAQVSTSPLVP